MTRVVWYSSEFVHKCSAVCAQTHSHTTEADTHTHIARAESNKTKKRESERESNYNRHSSTHSAHTQCELEEESATVTEKSHTDNKKSKKIMKEAKTERKKFIVFSVHIRIVGLEYTRPENTHVQIKMCVMKRRKKKKKKEKMVGQVFARRPFGIQLYLIRVINIEHGFS